MQNEVHSESMCILTSVSQFGNFDVFLKPNSVKKCVSGFPAKSY